MIVAAALERATAGRHYDALRTLAAIADYGVLSPSDAERLLAACGDGAPPFRMRAVLALGLPSPFAIDLRWPRIDVDSADMDGRGIEWTKIENDFGPDGGLIVPDALGTQVVQLHCTASARLARTPGLTLPLTLERTASVAAAPEEVVETITQPDIDAAVRHSVLRTSVWRSVGVSVSVDVAPVPVPVAVSVWVRTADREYAAGGFVVREDGIEQWVQRAHPVIPQTVEHVDIILRPDRRVALQTFDVDCIWDGEPLVISNVPVGE